MGLARAKDLHFSLPPHHRGVLDTRISRRRFVRGAAGVAGAAALASSLPARAAGRTGSPQPRPVPGGLDIPGLGHFDVWFPGKGTEPSLITDFHGVVGVADILGTGTGTDTPTDPSVGLVFEADMRFMQGEFVATNGKTYEGTFGFV